MGNLCTKEDHTKPQPSTETSRTKATSGLGANSAPSKTFKTHSVVPGRDTQASLLDAVGGAAPGMAQSAIEGDTDALESKAIDLAITAATKYATRETEDTEEETRVDPNPPPEVTEPLPQHDAAVTVTEQDPHEAVAECGECDVAETDHVDAPPDEPTPQDEDQPDAEE